MPERKAFTAIALAAVLAAVRWAGASGVDGAANINVIPYVVIGASGESHITFTNAGPEPLEISSIYVGAEGTAHAASRGGVFTCANQRLEPWGSVTVALHDLCGLFPPSPDRIEFGYLEATSRGDVRTRFYATSEVRTKLETFGIPGQPAGAFDPGLDPGLRVLGLRAPGVVRGETLRCYVATLGQAKKKVLVELFDGTTQARLGSQTTGLAARRMQRIDGSQLGAAANPSATNLWVKVTSTDPELVVAGCALEQPSSEGIAYQPAQTAAPKDTARLRSVTLSSAMQTGPYRFAVLFNCPPPHTPATCNKVILSTYLRWDDTVRCRLVRPDQTPYDTSYNNGDPSNWYELQMRHPDGTIVAGGNNRWDTGYFKTGHHGTSKASSGQRWLIEISYDETAQAQVPWQYKLDPGYWGLACESAAGLSEPLPVMSGPDDF
jgi:hypothetical protein